MPKKFSLVLILLAGVAILSASAFSQEPAAGAVRPNILFIAIDDMNDWAGFLDTHPQVQTPHMDTLATQGVSFTNAHVPAPICGPSRTAIMSGLWPTSNGIYTNAINYRRQMPHLVSLPEYLRQNGYYTMGVGKIFHTGEHAIPEGAFDEYGFRGSSGSPFTKEELSLEKQAPFNRIIKNGKEYRLPLNGFPADRHWRSTNTFDWGPVDVPDEEYSDTQKTNWAIEKLRESHEKPFFLALGFDRPHQPLYNPTRFHEMYPPESVVLPQTIPDDLGDVPRAGKEYALAPNTSGLHRTVAEYGQWKNAVSSYLASISYVDDLVGNVMAALEASPYADNTLIVLWSDHGWHLGEKEHWGKATGWYRSTRIPFLIVPPRNQPPEGFEPHSESARPVNLLDLAPTIADFGGIPMRKEWQGKSLVPLVADPDSEWQPYTHTTFGRGDHTITTERYQYLHYFDGAAELYDIQNDPDEFVNLANDPAYADVIEKLRQFVPDEPQWKHFVRYRNFKAVVPADGSPMALYNMGYRNWVNEQNNLAEDYPEEVAEIQKWLDENKPAGKYLTMEY
jgi:arylsulfatase A-like enzyme